MRSSNCVIDKEERPQSSANQNYRAVMCGVICVKNDSLVQIEKRYCEEFSAFLFHSRIYCS
jgi:hypothetical protein